MTGLSIIPILILGFFFLGNCSSESSDSFVLEGKWKDIKANTPYDVHRREILFDIQRIGEDYIGKVISLDNAIEASGDIRKCAKCVQAASSRMLLGFPVIDKLHRSPNSNKFIGKIYDIQQGKWFDLSIEPLNSNQIRVRIYAGITLFGKSIIWERGEEYYKQIISDSPVQIDKTKKGIYALKFGEIDSRTENEVFLKVDRPISIKSNNPIYFFSEAGKRTGEGIFINEEDGHAKVKLTNIFPAFERERSISVILYQK